MLSFQRNEQTQECQGHTIFDIYMVCLYHLSDSLKTPKIQVLCDQSLHRDRDSKRWNTTQQEANTLTRVSNLLILQGDDDI